MPLLGKGRTYLTYKPLNEGPLGVILTFFINNISGWLRKEVPNKQITGRARSDPRDAHGHLLHLWKTGSTKHISLSFPPSYIPVLYKMNGFMFLNVIECFNSQKVKVMLCFCDQCSRSLGFWPPRFRKYFAHIRIRFRILSIFDEKYNSKEVLRKVPKLVSKILFFNLGTIKSKYNIISK
jgi:hypothetical protein